MYCPKCAVRLVEAANFCHNCGLCVVEDGTEIIQPPLNGGVALSARSGSEDDLPTDILPPTKNPNGSSRSNGDEPETELWTGRFSPKAMVGSYASLILA